MAKKKIRYCSLDIETSGFDPAEGEILEAGILVFEIEKGEVKILKEWDSVFKPAKQVPAKILALTGIEQEEMENAPAFAQEREEIQKLVSECVIVGHNISFDIRFLEAFGINFSGEKLDTLDLAQIFLPTHGSYNLEALMNLFGIEHKSAHRALADSKASVLILEKLAGIFRSLPKELRLSIRGLFEGASPALWNFFGEEFPPYSLKIDSNPVELRQSAEIISALQDPKAVITFPLGFDYQNYVFRALSKLKGKSFLVTQNKKILCQLWRQGIVHPVFENRDIFNNEKFEDLVRGKDKFPREFLIFLAKILVWRHANWQNKVLLDLNFSFFGNQYRGLITFEDSPGPVWPVPKKEKIAAADYSWFITFSNHEELQSRRIIILDINNFESALTSIASKKISWNDYIYSVKQISDPTAGIGEKKLFDAANKALSEIDLFFGLAAINLKKINQESSNILLDEAAANTDYFMSVERSALAFVEKMETFNKRFQSERIKRLDSELLKFFRKEENQIKWAELFESRLVLHSSPLDLAKLAGEKLGTQQNILFTASLGSQSLVQYFISRLDLTDFEIRSIGQQELRRKLEVNIRTDIGQDAKKLLELAGSADYPLALIMPSQASIKEFYEPNFRELQKRFKVLAQGFSGGATKMLDNFLINDNSLLVVTDKFISKQQHKKLHVKNLIITRLPFDQFTHPLFAAQAQKYKNQFIEFNIPRALYNFHSLVRFFYGEGLERIYITDPKIRKDYGRYFLEYLSSLSFVEIKE